jgi:hypothetical protein
VRVSVRVCVRMRERVCARVGVPFVRACVDIFVAVVSEEGREGK